jgi:hypothetical protein
MFVNSVGPTGEPVGRDAQARYADIANVSLRALDAKVDPIEFFAGWFNGA